MIQQLKTGFKLLKYAYQFKLNMVCMSIIMVVGIFMKISMMFAFSGEDSFSGEMLMLMPAVFMTQLFSSLNVSRLVQVSPEKKKLQTSIPAVYSFVSSLAAYLLVTVFDIVLLNYHIIPEERFVFNRICDIAFFGVIMCYAGISYKYFVASTIIMFIALEAIIFGSMATITSFFEGISPVIGFLIGFIMIGVFGLIQYGLSLLVYKKPLSKYAQHMNLRNIV